MGSTDSPAQPGRRIPKGALADSRSREEMRKRYSALFEKSPELHANIVTRISLDNIIIDFEKVSGFQGNQDVKAIAYNEVENELITKVWFSR